MKTVAASTASGAMQQVRSYDAYGVTSAANTLRFQYTGQAAIPELGLLYYKARFYHPALGRFMQTDPIGYEDDLNLYAYVGSDPLNKTDPTGTDACPGLSRSVCLRADTFDASKSKGQNTVSNAKLDEAAVAGKDVVAVKTGTQEKLGYIDSGKDGTLSVKAVSNVKTESNLSTDSATASGLPWSAQAIIHGHIDSRSEGMVDASTGPGDSQPLTTSTPRVNFTVSRGRVGVREVVGGRLQFRMVDGRLSTSRGSLSQASEASLMQENLNRQQALFQIP